MLFRSEAGVNLEGIRRIMDLRAENDSLRARLAEVERDVRSTALVLWRGRRR